MHICALKSPLYPNFALPWRCDIMEYSSIDSKQSMPNFDTLDLYRLGKPAWQSGYCYLNKGECNLNQSKDNSFVERVAKNNSWNNGDRHKIYEIFLTNCFVFVITVVWKTVQSLAMTQIKAHLMEKKNIATNCFQVTVPVLAGWTRNPLATTLSWNFFHSDHQESV